MKISILGLEKTLHDLGYEASNIANFTLVIDHILQSGSCSIEGYGPRGFRTQVISAAGIRPLVKLNKKSLDVFLITTNKMDLLRIHHPENTWHEKLVSHPTRCLYTSRSWITKSAWDQKPEWKEKTFHF